MVYRVIGLMSGSSLDGLDIAYVHLQENAGQWNFEIIKTACYSYNPEWKTALASATNLSALEYQLLHTRYGHYLGEQVNAFITEHQLNYQVQLIASHGHTSFHVPEKKMTAQLGDGAAIAAMTGINVVSDLRAMDIALGGQGAPIVPIGEKMLFSSYDFFLNLGGIANLSHKTADHITGFDVCPANRVLDLLANDSGEEYDAAGSMAAGGQLQSDLLESLNALPYYAKPFPKSLANDFGVDVVYPVIKNSGYKTADALRTYVEHIVLQIVKATGNGIGGAGETDKVPARLLVTGGGAFNDFLIERLRVALVPLNIELVIPNEAVIRYKEALIMALIGILRWREENNVMASVTGATRNSIGGAVWIGQDA